MSETTNPERTQELERIAWKLRTRCWSQDDIADKLGVSQETVSRMLNRVAERLNKAFLQEITRMRLEQTAQLDHIARAALDAYEQYRTEPDEEAEQTENLEETETPLELKLPAVHEQTLSPGAKRRAGVAAAYLKVALKALADLRALWGLEAAKKTDIRPKIPAVKALIGIDIERLKEGMENLQCDLETGTVLNISSQN